MKYGELNLGQVEAMVNKLGGMDGVNRLLAGELVVTPKAPAKPKQVLNFKEDLTVGASLKALDLKTFFKDRSGLYVYDSFATRAKALLVKVPHTEAFVLKSFDLGQDAYDREIKAGLPEKHEVDLWLIARMIQEQEGGKDGPLLTNGYANIFYLGGFVVYVRWSADYGRWYVNDWDLDGGYWNAGHRVFSRN